MGKQSRNRQRGRAAEKQTAKALGGKAIGALSGEDVFTWDMSIEVKSRKKFVGKGWMEQAERNNVDTKVPLVVVHITGTKYEDDLVLMRIKDFQEMKLAKDN